MYNSIYPVKINYRKPQNFQKVKPKEEEQSSSSSYSREANQQQNIDTFKKAQTTGRTTFPNGTSSSIDYNKNKVNISQIITDFKNTTSAIGTPEDIAGQVNNYLSVIENQANKETPNVQLIKSNLKAASQVLDEYIATSLNKPSKVVENWVDALFLQNVDYKADPTAENPDYRVNIPQKKPSQVQPQEQVISQEQEQIKAEIIEETVSEKIVEQSTNNAKKSFVKARKYATMDNSTKALNEFRQTLKFAKEENDIQTEALVYYETGNIHAKNKEWASALEQYNNAINTSNDENIKARAHISMANIYSQTDYFKPAMEHYYDAISYAGESENLNLQTKALLDVGNMYAQKYDKNSSLQYLSLAKNIAHETQDHKVIGKTYQKSADVCEILSENHLALDNLKYSTFHYKQVNSSEKVAQNFEAAADLMSKLGNKEKAKSLLTKAYRQYQSCDNLDLANSVFTKLQQI